MTPVRPSLPSWGLPPSRHRKRTRHVDFHDGFPSGNASSVDPATSKPHRSGRAYASTVSSAYREKGP